MDNGLERIDIKLLHSCGQCWVSGFSDHDLENRFPNVTPRTVAGIFKKNKIKPFILVNFGSWTS